MKTSAVGGDQPEYVVVPDGLLSRTAELKPYFDASVAYVGSLKAKATTKPKTKAKAAAGAAKRAIEE